MTAETEQAAPREETAPAGGQGADVMLSLREQLLKQQADRTAAASQVTMPGVVAFLEQDLSLIFVHPAHCLFACFQKIRLCASSRILQEAAPAKSPAALAGEAATKRARPEQASSPPAKRLR